MSYKSNERGEAAARRRRLTSDVLTTMRELSIQLALLNHRVGGRLDLNDIDLDCLDLIARHGPLSPSALARRAGLHPATITGILDRLERGGWVARDRDAADRRAVVVRLRRERMAELLGQYGGMLTAMRAICADYDEAQLELITDFLRRANSAGHDATEALTSE
jgi:DNA-binding MarR family transcriptional regulator